MAFQGNAFQPDAFQYNGSVPPMPGVPPGTPGIYAGGPVFARAIIYQSVAYAPYAPLIAEVINADKWFTQASEPQRRFYPSNYRHDFNFEIAFNEDTATLAQKWHRPLSEPVRLKNTSTLPPHAFAFVEAPTLSAKWFSPLSEPQRRFHPGTYRHDFHFEIAFNEDSGIVPKWWTPLSEPQRKFHPGTYRHDYNFEIAFNEDTTTLAAKWWAPLSEPPRIKKLVPGDLFWNNFTPPTGEQIFADKWWQALSEPVRLPKRVIFQQDRAFVQAAPFEETVYPDKYWQELSRPNRRAFLAAHQDPHIDLPFNEVTAMFPKWWNALSEPVRFRSQLKASQQAAVWLPFVETTNDNVSKWFEPLTDPVRLKKLVPGQAWWSSHTPAPTEVVTLDKYWEQFTEPVRFRSQLRTAAQQFLALVKAAPFEETVYPDKYWTDLTRPARGRQLPISPYPYWFFTQREDTKLIGTWWRPLNEPVRRFNPGIYRQDYNFDVQRQPDVSMGSWWVRTNEPVRFPRTPRIYLPYSFGQYFAEPELITLDKWFRPLSEPARTRWFATALQQSLVWLSRPLAFEPRPARVTGVQCVRVAPQNVRFTYDHRRVPDPKRKRTCS